MLKLLSVLVLILTLGVGQMWGAITDNKNGTYTEPSGTGSKSSSTITWSFAEGNITVVQSKTGGTDVNTSYNSAARVYQGNTLTVSATNGFKVEKVEIVVSTTYYGAGVQAGTSVNNNVVGHTSDVTTSLATTSGGTHSFTPATAGAKTLFYIRNKNTGSTSTQLRWASGGLKVTYSYTAPTAVAAGTITSSDFGLSITDALNTNKYDVYFNTSGTAPTATTTPSETNETTKTPTISSGVSAGTTYYIWARSVKTISSNTWKSAWTALTGGSLTTESGAACTSEITITKGTPSNGSFTMTPGGGTVCIDEGNASVTISNINPSSGYRFKEITSSGGGTIDNNAKTVSNISATTTINVVFEPIPSHKVYFYNGTTLLNSGGTSVQEGTAVSYSGSSPVSCDTGEGASTTFAGWASAPWDGKISRNEITVDFYESTLPVMGNSDVTYHAVFCKGGSSSITITNSDFTGSSLSGSYSTQTITKAIGTTDYNFEINACIQSSMCQMRDNTTLSYIAIPALPGVITGISTTECANGSGSSYSGTLHFKHTKTRGNADTNDIGKKTLSSVTSFDWDLSANTTYTSGYLLTSAGLRLKDLTITYGTAGTNYMTTCCEPLAQINGSIDMNQNSAVLTWDDLGGVAASDPYAVTYRKGSDAYGSANVGEITTNAQGKKTCTITGLECGTEYD